ncbi:zinc ribbon domain-containing protein, partial [Acidiferrobacter sp.]|uniref:zinc ribbon domain-containing protein n=1 Tax=Acidiferrobacter sp. TaxID=1872107 RepID=UPI00342B66A7
VVADRWFPSSKTCSACGSVQEKMSLSVRHWICLDCGASHDRDVNAARNLLVLGLTALSRPTASSAGCEACGPAMRPAMGEGSGLRRKAKTKPASVKQEVSFVPV